MADTDMPDILDIPEAGGVPEAPLAARRCPVCGAFVHVMRTDGGTWAHEDSDPEHAPRCRAILRVHGDKLQCIARRVRIFVPPERGAL